jgi:hypothetical protein
MQFQNLTMQKRNEELFSFNQKKDASQHLLIYYFFLGTGGFNDGVLPGVSLLSRCRLSGLPVDSTILFGPVVLCH